MHTHKKKNQTFQGPHALSRPWKFPYQLIKISQGQKCNLFYWLTIWLNAFIIFIISIKGEKQIIILLQCRIILITIKDFVFCFRLPCIYFITIHPAISIIFHEHGKLRTWSLIKQLNMLTVKYFNKEINI